VSEDGLTSLSTTHFGDETFQSITCTLQTQKCHITKMATVNSTKTLTILQPRGPYGAQAIVTLDWCWVLFWWSVNTCAEYKLSADEQAKRQHQSSVITDRELFTPPIGVVHPYW